jgi:hypothetical protein
MKKLLLIAFIGSTFLGCKDFGPKDDTIDWPEILPKFEVIFILPQDGKSNEFIEKIKLHDSKFHNKTDETTTSLSYISAVMNSGYYTWAEGPMQYSYLDEKGKIEGHQEYWDLNIAPLIKDEASANYYSLQTPISYSNESVNYDANVLEVVGFKITDKPNARNDVEKMLYRWKKAFEERNSSQEFRIFYPELKDNFEADFYIVWPHESMESIETWKFNANKYLNEIYGKGTSKSQ